MRFAKAHDIDCLCAHQWIWTKWQSASTKSPESEHLEISKHSYVSRTTTVTESTLDKSKEQQKKEVNTVDYSNENFSETSKILKN